jgi:hypothetical protein
MHQAVIAREIIPIEQETLKSKKVATAHMPINGHPAG